MMVFLLGLLLWQTPQTAASPPPTQVISIVNEGVGERSSLRFVLNGDIASYSATREGGDIVVRIAAVAKPGLAVPIAIPPIGSMSIGSDASFLIRVAVPASWSHEMSRESSSLLLLLRPPRTQSTIAGLGLASSESATVAPGSLPLAAASPTPPADRPADAIPTDTRDLYQRLFPTSGDPSAVGVGRSELEPDENWYSNFTWLGLQMKPWLSMSYVDGKTTQVETNVVTSDTYLVIQPNLGIGLSPQFGGDRAGQWKVNYTPRFRRLVDVNLPRLTSHFFDIGVDQPVASFGSIYGSYHFSKGVLETDEVDPGREYGIGLNRVVDTALERFKRNSFGLGVRFDVVADTTLDLNVYSTKVKYGNVPGDEAFRFGERAFFDYETRLFNTSLRRGLGEGRFLSALFGVHDTPQQDERRQVEGRGYSYGVSVDGDIAAQTTGRLMFGYRTQKNPNAGEGGRDYKDITYGVQLVRELSESTTFGLTADRKLFLSAYEDNGFYVADGVRGDLSSKIPFGLYFRGSAGLQSNNYKASPQANTTGAGLILRKDRIRSWSLGLARSIKEWAYVRVDYAGEKRASNLDRFDIKTRALTIQLGLGFFGKPESQVKSSW